MSSSPERDFEDGLRRAAAAIGCAPPETISISYPPSASQGDLASAVCFEMARTARRPPRALAEALVAAFVAGGAIDRVEAAGAGYVNAYFDRRRCLSSWLSDPRSPRPPAADKVIVEHTNINPNKAAHIGHLRNAVLGDTLVRALRWLGRSVEVQNYIDDTGVQVADLVVGFRVLRGETLDAVRVRYDDAALAAEGRRFDYVCWDLYAEVTRFYEEDAEHLKHRRETLHAMEAGGNPIAELAAHLAGRMVRHHLETMDRLGIRYDLLPKESDILAHGFWQHAFARLRAADAVRLVEAGKNAGCWVMDLPGVEEGAGEDQKIIVRSDGTVTYVGKDIAYQLWKFGLLGKDFAYRRFGWGDRPGYALWETTHGPDAASDAPAFGAGHTVYNVIDARQAYLQRVVALGLTRLGHADEAGRSVHFSYEMVALTPAAVAAMFPDFPLSAEDRKKPHIEMSGRRGLGVRADDLVDALIARARQEVSQRNSDAAPETVELTARRIAIGALRYYMLRFSRNRVVAFDLEGALAFEGETGPYLQYSVVRARNILSKLAERRGRDECDPDWLARHADLAALPEDEVAALWEIPLQLSRVESVARQAVGSLELAALAKHAYILAQTFNSFYHRSPVAQEDDAKVRWVRAAVTRIYHDGMSHLLSMMGIDVPDRM